MDCKSKKSVYQWTRLSFNKDPINTHDWLPEEFNGLRSIQPIRGEDMSWRRVIQPAGSRYFIVGDAAMVLDPASSHGVLRALMSGIKATHTLFHITKNRSSLSIAIKDYNNWMSKWFFHDIKKLKKIYRRHPNCPIWIEVLNNLWIFVYSQRESTSLDPKNKEIPRLVKSLDDELRHVKM